MFLFRPGIREEEIQFINFSGGEYFWYFLTEYFQENHIFPSLAFTFLISADESLEFEFYSHTRSIRIIASVIAEEVSHPRAYLEHQFVLSEKLLPLTFLIKHLCLIAPNARMLSDFLDVDILIWHARVVCNSGEFASIIIRELYLHPLSYQQNEE